MVKEIAVLILHDGDRILIQDRHSMSKLGEEWGFFGGKIEPDESPEEAMLREASEELAYAPAQYQSLGLERVEVDKDRYVLEHLFTAPLPPMEELEVREGDGMRLLPIAEARKLKFLPGEARVFDRLQKHVRTARPLISCTALILHRDGKVLLQGREGISKQGEEWSFWGGKIERGESPTEGLHRELREELNLDMDHIPYEHLRTTQTEFPHVNLTSHFFIAELPDGIEPRLLEGSAMEWFAVAEARRLKLFPGDSEILADVQARIE